MESGSGGFNNPSGLYTTTKKAQNSTTSAKKRAMVFFCVRNLGMYNFN
jgi:hypothetical protein